MPRLSKIGAAALAAFGWTSGISPVTANYLVVAGGGGGGSPSGGGGGGGGAGGFRTATASLNPTLSYTVTVGAGGVGASVGSAANGTNGSNSIFDITTSAGGGFGAGYTTGNAGNGGSGGSGGGSAGNNPTTSGGAGNTPSTSPSQGNNGGGASNIPNGTGGGGGGGAGGSGSTATTSAGANGGNGSSSSISGSSVTYAGGGGGGADFRSSSTVGTGGTGGGGNGGGASNAVPGTANLGGGGGGGQTNGSGNGQGGANGGSGVVIISYAGPQQFGGGVVTSSGGNTIHTFTTSGTLSPLSSLTASYLIVAGGGGGGGEVGGGGGAGGLLSGSGLTIDTNSIYVVTVGAAGAAGGATGPNGSGGNGGNSSLSIVSTTAIGGGGGGSSALGTAAGNGGSGGGSGGFGTTIGTGTSGQGFGGGASSGAPNYPGGGGGGASAVGGNASPTVAGVGGAGTASSISGTSVTYATGGNGGRYNTGNINGTTASSNTGNGGGGGSANGGGLGVVGGAGGSGIVIISYPGSTQQMAGGTVTVAGGNVIHTFTSSGYLTPITLVNRSLRFRASATAYLSRTPTVSGNRRTFTLSYWMKRGALGSTQYVFAAGSGTTESTWFQAGAFDTNGSSFDATSLGTWTTGGGQTTALFRDPSAWYHFVWAVDTTQATASNRVRLWVNGVQQILSTPTITQNADLAWNNAGVVHYIGSRIDSGPRQLFDGYLTEINSIDGQALTPSSFGTFNGLGVWQPIRYGGSYGTNGFYLPFTNTTSTTTLVADSSPNGNNWTPNNISLTAGSTYDSMTDVPTLTSATAANYAVLNPLNSFTSPIPQQANLYVPSTDYALVKGTFFVSTGKWYWEWSNVSGTLPAYCGVSNASITSYTQYASSGISWYGHYDSYTKNFTATSTAAETPIAIGDIIGISVDCDAGEIKYYRNNTLVHTDTTLPPNTEITPTLTTTFSGIWANVAYNFGQRPFAYTPPTGFLALNTFNLPTPTIGATPATTANKYFNAVLWTGNGNTPRSFTGIGFAPDFAWMKSRSTAADHALIDIVRGTGAKALVSNSASAENGDGLVINSFDSDGYTLATGSFNFSYANTNAANYVSWNWKANGTGVTNTAGSITSTVSANTTAGFSIVTYTGNNTSGATVGHGLGVAPQFIITKQRNGTDSWNCYHVSLGNDRAIFLNQTATPTVASSFWNNTSPSSTVFTLGNAGTNQNNNVAYCFAAVAGYSAFGSYTGNGSSDGPFVFCGFRPRYLMIKASSAVYSWIVYDSARNTYNTVDLALLPNTADAEAQQSAGQIDFLSNGFKLRATGAAFNNNGTTFIYAAFAENPFKYANAR